MFLEGQPRERTRLQWGLARTTARTHRAAVRIADGQPTSGKAVDAPINGLRRQPRQRAQPFASPTSRTPLSYFERRLHGPAFRQRPERSRDRGDRTRPSVGRVRCECLCLSGGIVKAAMRYRATRVDAFSVGEARSRRPARSYRCSCASFIRRRADMRFDSDCELPAGWGEASPRWRFPDTRSRTATWRLGLASGTPPPTTLVDEQKGQPGPEARGDWPFQARYLGASCGSRGVAAPITRASSLPRRKRQNRGCPRVVH